MEFLAIYVISDSVGETGEQVARAVISQYEIEDYKIRKFPYVLNLKHLKEVLDEIKTENCIVLYSLVKEELADFVDEFCVNERIPSIDILSPLLKAITYKTNLKPLRQPGTNRKLDDRYFKRVEAIEFAVRYDDGKDAKGFEKADLVLIGVSRTSKTPLSMYLANRNIKVANLPLVPEVPWPKELFDIPAKKIIGLTNNPEKLYEIRQERLKALGLNGYASYASMERILEEIDYAESVMKKIGCPIINVSTKAIEETSGLILEILKENGFDIYKDSK